LIGVPKGSSAKSHFECDERPGKKRSAYLAYHFLGL